MRETYTGTVHEKLQSMQEPMRIWWRSVFLGRDPTLEHGKIIRNPPLEKEKAGVI